MELNYASDLTPRHSKITPKRPQITPDHTQSSQEHAFGTDFLVLDLPQTVFLHCPPSPPQTEGTCPPTSNSLSVAAFRFKSEKKHISGQN